jgi:pyruvate oxidase
MNLAELVVKALAEVGVKHLYGIPGDAINDMTNALRRQDRVRFVGVRHEEAGVFAAAAEAKLSGEPGACMGTAGPGAIHLLNGLYDAKMDHAPVIALTGQVATDKIGTAYHQEVDLERLFSDVALYSRTIMTPDQAPAVLQEACRAAVAGRGVAHVSIPTDLAGSSVAGVDVDHWLLPKACTTFPCPDDVMAAERLINRAERPVVLAGVGCRGAEAMLLAFARKIGAPIVRTLRGKDVIDDDPMCIGGIGLLGGQPAVDAIERCDLLVMVGTDFPYADFYPRKASIIQIDRDPTQIGKRYPVDVALVGDARPTLGLLAEKAEVGSDAFLRACQSAMDEWLQAEGGKEYSEAVPIKPQRLVGEVARAAGDDAIFVCDTGTVDAWTARHLRVREGQRYTLSSALGSMGFALPGAIGAKMRYPDRQVFALAGDGGFNMLCGDFITAVVEGLPIICIVLNNSRLGFIALEQMAKGLPPHAVDLVNPDFAAFAQACDGVGITVSQPNEIGPALERAVAADRPALLDVQVDPDELILPPKVSVGDAVNFAVAKVREIVNR